MSDMKMVRRCLRCGAAIQSEDPEMEGYLSPDAPIDGDAPILCASCLKEASWNEAPAEEWAPKEYLKALSDAKRKGALFLYVIDLFSFECSFASEVCKILDGAHVLVLANKRDLLPDGEDDISLAKYVAHRFHTAGMRDISPKDVRVISLSFSKGVSDIAAEIESIRNGKDVWLVGAKGSGKSLFVEVFLSSYRNESNLPIASCPFPGTDDLAVKVPLPGGAYLYDTPGFALSNSFSGRLSCLPKSFFPDSMETPSPRRLMIDNGGALFLGLLGRVEVRLHKRFRAPVTAYVVKSVELKAIPPKKSLGSLFDKYLEKKALKPALKGVSSSLDFDAFEYSFEKKETRDFGIAGLGWLTFEGEKGDTLRVYVPKGIGVYTTSRPKLGEGKK